MKLSAAGGRMMQWMDARTLERASGIVSVLLVLAIAWSVARLTWLFVPSPPQEAPPVQAPGVAVLPASGSSKVAGAEIAALHLFGEPQAEAAPPPETVTAAPETQLNLTLRGLVASDNEAEARAIIASPEKDEAPYRVGDELPGNATLKQILSDRVILLRNGRYETLSLPKDEPVGRAAATQPRASLPGVTRSAAPTAQGSLREFRDSLLNNPESLQDLVSIEPVRDGDRLTGYQLNPGRDAQMLGRYGLRPGDVVTAINGVQLSNPDGSARALQSITSAEVINLTVMRNGRQETFTFRMD